MMPLLSAAVLLCGVAATFTEGGQTPVTSGDPGVTNGLLGQFQKRLLRVYIYIYVYTIYIYMYIHRDGY